jgi:L-malate glycosyltransferase
MAARRLKVLFITSWYPTKEEPAKAVWVREHAKAVRLFDDAVVLHCAGSVPALKVPWRIEKEADDNLAEGVPTWRLWYRSSRVTKLSYFNYLWSIFQAYRYIVSQGFQPDVINVHVYDAGVPAILLGKCYGTPVVVSEHFSSFPRRLLGRLDFCKAWLAMRGANVVLPVSYSLQRAIERYGIRAHFQVVPNAVDTNVFFPSTQARNAAGARRILFVGRLTPVRGVEYLLQALRVLRRKRDDWHVDIVGDGPARREHERMTADFNLDAMVEFHGVMAKRGVAELMRKAALFVLPSLAETFSVPAAEALASGIPVLATRCGGPEEFLNDDTGRLVPAGDADALGEGLDCMLDNLHSYSGDWIAQYAKERFSAESVGAKLHAVYQSVVRNHLSLQ